MEIKFYDESPFEDEKMKAIFLSIYGEREFDFNYWNWRFKNNPFRSGTQIAYMEDNSRLVSFYAISETKFNDRGKLLRCGLMNSAMTHPEYGGKGLFAKLEVALHNRLLNEKGYDFLYGFANHNAHRIHRKHAGWQDLFILNNFYGSSKSILKRNKEVINFQHAIEYAKDFDFSTISKFNVSKSNFGFARTKDILNWRFLDPRYSYKVLSVIDNSMIIGAIIFKEYMGSIDIMEIFVESNQDMEKVLVQGVVKLATKSKGIYIWSNLFSNEHILLESLGFQERDFNTYFGYISNNYKIDREKVHVRFMDSDVY